MSCSIALHTSSTHLLQQCQIIANVYVCSSVSTMTMRNCALCSLCLHEAATGAFPWQLRLRRTFCSTCAAGRVQRPVRQSVSNCDNFLTIRYFNAAADFIPCRGAVCHYWRILARLAMSPSATGGCDACACVQRCVCARASAAPCDFVILMGDDVRLETIGWIDAVESAFDSVKQRLLQREDLPATEASCLPPFGCVALHDLSMPGAHPRGHDAPIPEALSARKERSGARVCTAHG